MLLVNRKRKSRAWISLQLQPCNPFSAKLAESNEFHPSNSIIESLTNCGAQRILIQDKETNLSGFTHCAPIRAHKRNLVQIALPHFRTSFDYCDDRSAIE